MVASKQWAKRRGALVRAYHEASVQAEDLRAEGRTGAAGVLFDRLAELRRDYLAILPVKPLGRDPLSGEVIGYAIDDVDLDGPWWDAEAPVRPARQPLPAAVFAVTGALRLGGDPTPAPFLCKPGPDVPYVLPRLLEHDGMLAVISSLPVGIHTGYPIVYVAPAPHPEIVRANTWGTNAYVVERDGRPTWNAVHADVDEHDFDLAPWIEQRKLAWIAPGDESLTLRDSVDGCPYLGLDGRTEHTRIQNGRAWWPSDLP